MSKRKRFTDKQAKFLCDALEAHGWSVFDASCAPARRRRPSPSATAPSPTSPRSSSAKLFKAEVRLSDETLEDSIERGELRQTIMEMIAEAISRDKEEIVVSGDTASADPFLATMDGVVKQATSHVVDAAGAHISKNLLADMLKTLPSEHLRDKKSMGFLTSVDADLDYRNALAERATAVGDKFLEGDTPVLYSGVPVQPIPLFPENLGAGSDRESFRRLPIGKGNSPQGKTAPSD